MTARHRREVVRKSDARLQRETALKWSSRAQQCWAEYLATGKMSWRDRAFDYRHEAIEHAALVGDGGKLVGEVERKLGFKVVDVLRSLGISKRKKSM